jgi:hypothetical protein
LGISFISVLDQKAINNLAVRIITIVVLSVSWYDPLLVATKSIATNSVLPQFLWISFPLILMAPFFYTSITIFTGPIGLAEKIQSTITMRLSQSADSFPEAEKAEAGKEWDRAFAIYRDKYLPKQYQNPIVWQRIVGILRRWGDPEKAFNELLMMVKKAPNDDARVHYAIQAADCLALGIGSMGRASKLLKAILPVFTQEAHRLMVNGKLAAYTGAETTARHQPPLELK